MTPRESTTFELLLDHGRTVDAILTAAGHQPSTPAPWSPPSREQVDAARRMQIDPPTRRVN